MSKKKCALVTGVSGQDGGYLVDYLLSLDYKVWGLVRSKSSSTPQEELLHPCTQDLCYRYGDLTDPSSLRSILKEAQPDEIYNLAAQSHVRVSFDIPEYTSAVNGTGVISLLQGAQEIVPQARFYQASTSELFGSAPAPQSEKTPFHPRSPYSVSKMEAYWGVVNYRESYGLFACNGILFNHESPRRGENFVTRKITKAAARIKHGKQKVLTLGNLDSKRDWGYAKNYVKAMYLMLQQDEPEDFVIATGEAHRVRDFLEQSFQAAGIPIESNQKSGVDEKYIRRDTGEVVVEIDPHFYRPAEVDYLLGDSSKAKAKLGWVAETPFAELVSLMVEHDLEQEAP